MSSTPLVSLMAGPMNDSDFDEYLEEDDAQSQQLLPPMGHLVTRETASNFPLALRSQTSLSRFGISSSDSLSPFTIRESLPFGVKSASPMVELRRNISDAQRKRLDLTFCRKQKDRSVSMVLNPAKNVDKLAEHNRHSLFNASIRSSISHQPISVAVVDDDNTARTATSVRVGGGAGPRGLRTAVRTSVETDALFSNSSTDPLGMLTSARPLVRQDTLAVLKQSMIGALEREPPKPMERYAPRLRDAEGRCSTPFYHCASKHHVEEMSKLILTSCAKIDEIMSHTHDQKHSADTTDYDTLLATSIKSIRPIWQITKKRYQMVGGAFTYGYKLHIRQFWRYCIGRVLHHIHNSRMSLLKAARKGLEMLKAARLAEEAKALAKKRAKLAEILFQEIIVMQSSRKTAVPLTKPLYQSLRTRFLELSQEGTETINLREFVGHGRIDANLIRKLDRDQSGTLDFFEVLKATFPSVLQKDLLALTRKWEINRDSDVPQESPWSLLGPEARTMVTAMFRLCDPDGKGVISKQDMQNNFVPEDWDPEEPLWFEQYFPTTNRVVSFEEFIDMVKFCFPPFKHSAGHKTDAKKEGYKGWRLPNDVIEAQERATACD